MRVARTSGSKGTSGKPILAYISYEGRGQSQGPCSYLRNDGSPDNFLGKVERYPSFDTMLCYHLMEKPLQLRPIVCVVLEVGNGEEDGTSIMGLDYKGAPMCEGSRHYGGGI